MRLLLDQNISRRLVTTLATIYPDSTHVVTVGLDEASDEEIWAYARQHEYIIVSKDSDFRQLAFLRGPPPKAIWLRVGNGSTTAIGELMHRSVEIVERFVASEDEALLVLPSLDA